jgi:hypothetical protein
MFSVLTDPLTLTQEVHIGAVPVLLRKPFQVYHHTTRVTVFSYKFSIIDLA